MDKTIGFYEKEGYQGVDVNLETSLFEYGLIWTKNIVGHENDYHFIYGVANNGEEFTRFDWADVAIDTDPEKEWDWADFNAVAKFCGYSKADFLAQELPEVVYALISYYGIENVMGGSYYPFKISKEEVKS